MKKDTQIAFRLSKLLKKLVLRGFGKCKEYDFGCVVCQANRVANEVEQLAGLLRELDNIKLKK